MKLSELIGKKGIKAHEEKIWGITEFFSVLSDPTRVKIILLLLEGEKCVGEIAEELEVDQPVVSHQLKILRHLKIVKTRRSGKHIRYKITDRHIEEALNVGLNHVINCIRL